MNVRSNTSFITLSPTDLSLVISSTSVGREYKDHILQANIKAREEALYGAERAPHFLSSIARERRVLTLLEEAVGLFNDDLKSPKIAIDELISDLGIVKRTPADIGMFLLLTEGLKKWKIGKFFGDPAEFHQRCLTQFLSFLDLRGLEIDEALRFFVSRCFLPGESQIVYRTLEIFASRYVSCNPRLSLSVDDVFTLTYLLVIVNTSLQMTSKAQKITKQQFLQMIRKSGVKQIPSNQLLRMYERITANRLTTETEASGIQLLYENLKDSASSTPVRTNSSAFPSTYCLVCLQSGILAWKISRKGKRTLGILRLNCSCSTPALLWCRLPKKGFQHHVGSGDKHAHTELFRFRTMSANLEEERRTRPISGVGGVGSSIAEAGSSIAEAGSSPRLFDLKASPEPTNGSDVEPGKSPPKICKAGAREGRQSERPSLPPSKRLSSSLAAVRSDETSPESGSHTLTAIEEIPPMLTSSPTRHSFFLPFTHLGRKKHRADSTLSQFSQVSNKPTPDPKQSTPGPKHSSQLECNLASPEFSPKQLNDSTGEASKSIHRVILACKAPDPKLRPRQMSLFGVRELSVHRKNGDVDRHVFSLEPPSIDEAVEVPITADFPDLFQLPSAALCSLHSQLEREPVVPNGATHVLESDETDPIVSGPVPSPSHDVPMSGEPVTTIRFQGKHVLNLGIPPSSSFVVSQICRLFIDLGRSGVLSLECERKREMYWESTFLDQWDSNFSIFYNPRIINPIVIDPSSIIPSSHQIPSIKQTSSIVAPSINPIINPSPNSIKTNMKPRMNQVVHERAVRASYSHATLWQPAFPKSHAPSNPGNRSHRIPTAHSGIPALQTRASQAPALQTRASQAPALQMLKQFDDGFMYQPSVFHSLINSRPPSQTEHSILSFASTPLLETPSEFQQQTPPALQTTDQSDFSNFSNIRYASAPTRRSSLYTVSHTRQGSHDSTYAMARRPCVDLQQKGREFILSGALRTALFQGIPASCRSRVWKQALGAGVGTEEWDAVNQLIILLENQQMDECEEMINNPITFQKLIFTWTETQQSLQNFGNIRSFYSPWDISACHSSLCLTDAQLWITGAMKRVVTECQFQREESTRRSSYKEDETDLMFPGGSGVQMLRSPANASDSPSRQCHSPIPCPPSPTACQSCPIACHSRPNACLSDTARVYLSLTLTFPSLLHLWAFPNTIPFLLDFQNCEEAFSTLANLIISFPPLNEMVTEHPNVRVKMEWFTLKIKNKFPILSTHLHLISLDVNLFLFSWLSSLFVDSPLPPSSLPRAWDILLFFGESSAYSLALALLSLQMPKLLECNLRGALLQLSERGVLVDEEALFDRWLNTYWINSDSFKLEVPCD